MSKGEAKPQKSPAEKLRNRAEAYIAAASEAGRLTLSHVYYDEQLQHMYGYTEVKTDGGVGILKTANGDIIVTGEYKGKSNGKIRTLSMQAELIESSFPVVSELNHEAHQSRMGRIPLDRAAGDIAINRLTRLIPKDFSGEATSQHLGQTDTQPNAAEVLANEDWDGWRASNRVI